MPYETHPLMEEPELTQKLWRYMDLAKFISLLQKQALYLPSLHQLTDDPWEGLPSPLNFNPDCPISITEINDTNSRTFLGTLSDIERTNPGHIYMKKQLALQEKKTVYANCWHMNDGESDAQWKIYGGSIFSLAIVTSFEKIKNSIVDNRTVLGTKIKYISHNHDYTPEGNCFFPSMHKRIGYIHEKEFRLIAFHPDNLPSGVFVLLDLSILIEKIIVSPRAPQWLLDTICCLVTDYGLTVEFIKSDFLDPLIL